MMSCDAIFARGRIFFNNSTKKEAIVTKLLTINKYLFSTSVELESDNVCLSPKTLGQPTEHWFLGYFSFLMIFIFGGLRTILSPN